MPVKYGTMRVSQDSGGWHSFCCIEARFIKRFVQQGFVSF